MKKLFMALGLAFLPVLVALILYVLFGAVKVAAHETVIVTLPIEQQTRGAQITYYAEKYDVSVEVLKKVMFCESSNNPKATGDGGRALGLFQYHAPTFEMFAKQLGEKLNRESPHDQIKLTAWAFSKGLQNHWTCYSKLYSKTKPRGTS